MWSSEASRPSLPRAHIVTPQTLAAYGFIEDRPTDIDADKGGQPCDGRGADLKGADGAAALEREKALEGDRRSNGLVWSFVGGSFAGLCQAAVIIPTDTIKIKLQVCRMWQFFPPRFVGFFMRGVRHGGRGTGVPCAVCTRSSQALSKGIYLTLVTEEG